MVRRREVDLVGGWRRRARRAVGLGGDRGPSSGRRGQPRGGCAREPLDEHRLLLPAVVEAECPGIPSLEAVAGQAGVRASARPALLDDATASKICSLTRRSPTVSSNRSAVVSSSSRVRWARTSRLEGMGQPRVRPYGWVRQGRSRAISIRGSALGLQIAALSPCATVPGSRYRSGVRGNHSMRRRRTVST